MTNETVTQLSSTGVQPVDMENEQVAHLAGVFDAVGSFTAHIIKGGGTRIGYRIEPLVRLNRPTSEEYLMGKLDAYCEDYDVRYTIAEKEREQGNVYVFEVKHPESILNFIEPMMPYLVAKHEEAVIMMNEVVPRIQADEHLTKEGFYELMGYVDRLRESARYGNEPKYTQSYFAEEWADDLDVD